MKPIIICISGIFVLPLLNACSFFGEEIDLVAQGSLTLTPLVIPEGMSKPVEQRSALAMPETINPLELAMVEIVPTPPPLDIDKANAEMESLQPALESEQQKKERLTLASNLKQTPDGKQFLIVRAKFDRVWESIPDVVRELGFQVEDRNRSKHYYTVSRDIPKTPEQEQKEEDSGIVSELGNTESYQIYIETQDESHSLVSLRNNAGQDDASGLARLLLVQIKAAFEQPIQ
ncbi:MAG: outer membrane protein assembly factor BamC [Thiohalomonadales bacterium]